MTTPQTDVVNFYLADLTLALRILPVEVRREIHSGIAEELRGLDADAAQRRIDELGDPKFIAAAALDEVGPVKSAEAPVLDKAWYTRATILVLLFGGLVIPFVGWFVGAVMLWGSNTWTTVDKVIGTLVLPFGFAGSLLISFAFHSGYATADPIGVLVGALAFLPIASAFYLAIRAILRSRRG